ncbi:phosphopantetheine adenylyltransferase [Halobacteriales archaeon Cl-PHB]
MRVAVAGTFGPLHDGHRALFETALERGTDGVVVAVTSDDLAQETRLEPRPVPTFETRRQGVREAIEAIDRWNRDVTVERLTARYGIASTDGSIDALVTSPETCGELAEINRRRATNDLELIEGIVVPYVRGEDGERLSSTRLVRGEIDEHGALQE